MGTTTLFHVRMLCDLTIVLAFSGCHRTPAPDRSGIPAGSDSVCTAEKIEAISLSEPERAMALVDSAESKHRLSYFDAMNLRSIICQHGFHQNRRALYYCKELYERIGQEKVDTEKVLSLLSRMSTLCMLSGYFPNSVRYANEGLEIARREGMRQKEALLLLDIGMAMFELGARPEGQQYLSQSISILKEIMSDEADWTLVESYIIALCNQMAAYNDDLSFLESIALIPEIDQALDLLRSNPPAREGLVDMREANSYALFAETYQQAGDHLLAEKYYRKLTETRYSKQPYGALLMVPYLINSSRFKEAQSHLLRAKKDARDKADTLNHEYIDKVLTRELLIYRGLGCHHAASDVALTIVDMLDNLEASEAKSEAIELAVMYRTSEKDKQLLLQETRIRRKSMALFISAFIIALVSVMLLLLSRKNALIRRKNKATKALVNELLAYREEVFRLKGRNPVECGLDPESEDTINEGRQDDDYDRMLFRRIEQVIISKSLYLHPKLSREDIIQEVHVPKNRFGSLFKRYAGMNFPSYINNMRLDHAAQLLKAHPEYTVEAVASDSGIPAPQTFYRLFFEKFGLTPTEFRKAD